LWSVDLGGYVGAGGEVIFGSDNGHGFLTVRLGFGIGVAAEFDRKGGIPGGTEATGCGGGGVLSVSAKGAVGFGPFLNGGFEAGVFNNVTAHVQDGYAEGHFGILGLSPEGLKANEGFHAFIPPIGAQVSLYRSSRQ
jgi:hypothetical protein